MKNDPYDPDNWVGALGEELPGQEDLPFEERIFTLVCMHCGEPQQGTGEYRCPDCCDSCRETVTAEQQKDNYIKHTKDCFNQRRAAVEATRKKKTGQKRSRKTSFVGGAR